MALESPIAHPPDWPVRRLGDISLKIGSGATPRGGQDAYLPERTRYALVRSQNVFDRRFETDGLAYISDEQAAQLRGVVLQPDDLLLNITGDGITFARSCMVPPEVLPACVNQHVSIIRLDRSAAEPGYILTYLTHPAVKHYVEAFNAGGSRRAITKGHIESFAVPLPPLAEQRAIAHILGTLDDKIELNRRMSETLEEMARALFQSWFGEITPSYVKASDMIRDAVLEAGDGYRAKNEELGQTGLPFIRAADLRNGFDTEGADRLRTDSVAKAVSKISRVGDVAFTSKGTIGRFARVGETTDRFVYSPQVCFWRSLDPQRLHPALLYCWVQTEDFVDQVMAVAGQTDMAPYVSLRDQRTMKVPVLPPTQAAIGDKIEALLARQSVGLAQSRTLAALRDTLLPKLISGEILVGDAERLAEAAS